MTLPDTGSISSCSLSRSLSTRPSQQPSGNATPLPFADTEGDLRLGGEAVRIGESTSEDMDCFPVDGLEQWGTLDSMPGADLEDGPPQKHDLENTDYFVHGFRRGVTACDDKPVSRSNKPFHRWMKTLHKRAVRRQAEFDDEGDPPPYAFDMDSGSSITGSGHHRHSSSGSSFRFVRAVRSASMSITTASVLTRSRRNTHLSSRGHSRTDRSSRASLSGARLSEDSFCLDRPVSMDPATIERSLQRRRILEELISTEESYIGDVRFLMNVYVTMLASLPTLPAGLRSSINRNLTDIVELHEEMLGDLHRAVPDSEYTQPDISLQLPPPGPSIRGHHRWRSLDAVPEDKDGVSWLRNVPGVLADPQTAAEVAKVFSKKMNRFFIYEEYGAKYELMIKDVASAHRTMPKWQSYQKGLEVLAASLGSANSQDDHSKKSLTIGDLLVKPIQRVCKYPLLFAELLKHTPVIDCPYSHMEIENTLIRLREATTEINRATDDARIKSVLEKTWILQDRLVFPNQQLDAASKNRIRSFGHLQLCGALHVCWQTTEGVSGQYMVALLYREWLCLATASRTDQIYTIQACVSLANIKLEDVDNGRGIQCHTAPYSWKLVFICDHQLYEVILTACTPKEEMEWRSRLSCQQDINGQDLMQPTAFSFLALNTKSLGTVFRKPGTIARRISIHRATTVGPKSPLCQVILKNTSVIKDAPPSITTGSQINRSQSLLTTTARIPVLAPSRGERARLEALLSDVWTRDILPFPGITARSRSEHLVRASASSMMRKLSVVSIASSFSKRSASLASLQQKAGEDETSQPFCNRDKDLISAAGLSAEMMEDASRSLLSVIPDEVERNSPSLCAMDTERETDGALMMIRRFDRAEIRSEADGDSLRPYTPVLLQTSANNSRPNSARGSSFTKSSIRDEEKENVRASSQDPFKASPRPRKLSSRWSSRVGGLHRETVVQSIRNIFR
ncbi:hypothetical protein B0T16DRAFT_57920 [Cercophora newfieldiana]|uniref:DH domain-containing protein n=1 Tax=Cercophora newfieldiana TaxID=92897 RepID=A0AA39YRI5_9PEZI|nr:hypothetical protein B0T16DRAFT_57920 [Cercophora newfieldiana]